MRPKGVSVSKIRFSGPLKAQNEALPVLVKQGKNQCSTMKTLIKFNLG
jgi:hypothetical protein